MSSTTSGRRLIAAEKRARVIELRKTGKTIKDIATDVGLSRQMVHRILKKELARLNRFSADGIEEWRTLEMGRLDELLASLWAKATSGDTEAVGLVLKIIERQSRLMGLVKTDRVSPRPADPLSQLSTEELVSLAQQRGLPIPAGLLSADKPPR
jgi:hypothetical protein